MVRQKLNENSAKAAPHSSRTVGKLVAEIGERIIELHRANPMLSQILIQKISQVQLICTCPYVVETSLCIISDLTIPGPQALAVRYGITKQAISKASLDAMAKLDHVDGRLAKNLRRYAQGAMQDTTPDPQPEHEETMPEIGSAMDHITEAWQLEDYLEGMAVKIANAPGHLAKVAHWKKVGDRIHLVTLQVELADRITQAVTVSSKHFLRHTKADFKGWKLKAYLEDLIDRLVYQ